MPSLARRNLLHDRVRFVVTLTGIVFSVVLASIQLGLFVGFTRATADIITHSNADLWVKSKGVPNFENGEPFSERKRYQILGVAGVERAEKMVAQFGSWKRQNGAVEGCLLLGFNIQQNMGAPWNLTQGKIEDLAQPDAVIIDELYKDKLGVTDLGQTVEIRAHRARVVGFTRGIRSFTTSPPVFTTFKNAQDYFGIKEDQTIYVLVKVKQGYEIEDVKQSIAARVSAVDVLTTDEWRRVQSDYWMFGTGAGVTVLIAAALGILVGVVVVAQTIYSATVDHIREYGTLKAMGATNIYIYKVIIKQAVISALIGYAIGMTIALGVAFISQQGTTAVILPAQLVAGLFVLTVVMCAGASVVAINKVTRIDPAMVFKG